MSVEKKAEDFAGSNKTRLWRWVVGLRLAAGAFILVSFLLLRFHDSAGPLGSLGFKSGLAAIGLYLLLVILRHRHSTAANAADAGRFWPLLLIVGDLTLTICITLVSGGRDSPFVFLFLVAVINSSFLGGVRLSLIVAPFSAAL